MARDKSPIIECQVEDISGAYATSGVVQIKELSKALLLNKQRVLDALGFTEQGSVSKFDFPQKDLFSATSEMMAKDHQLFGHGRSEDMVIAVAKAFGENLERVVAFEAMRNPSELKVNSLTCTDGCVKFAEHRPAVFPPASLRSSNGWAIHYSLKAAVDGALSEAIERTLLQTQFLAAGWDGFRNLNHLNLHGLQQTVWLSTSSLAGYKAGIVDCSLRSKPGRTFGYFVLPASMDAGPGEYFQGIFEAIEPALYMDSHPEYKPDPADQISMAQFNWANRNEKEIFTKSKAMELQQPHSFLVGVAALDVSKWLGLEIPLFAAWVFGGAAVPLIIPKRVDGEALMYLNSVLGEYGLQYRDGDEIPIL